MPTLTIIKVKCRRESDSGSECEIYLKGEGAKIWPNGSYKGIAEDQTINLNLSRTYSSDFTVELWEQDDTSPDDYIGGFTVTESSRGETRALLSGDGNSFDLYYRVDP